MSSCSYSRSERVSGISSVFLVTVAVEVSNSFLQRVSRGTDNNAVNTTVLVLDANVKDVVLRIGSLNSLDDTSSDSSARNTKTHVTQFIGQTPQWGIKS